MNSWINLNALWKIVVIGALAGAGLPALFAVGLRALSTGPRTAASTGTGGTTATATATADGEQVVGGNPAGIAAAVVCFAVVLAAIGWGIYSIVNHS
jgi:hypothetical protein